MTGLRPKLWTTSKADRPALPPDVQARLFQSLCANVGALVFAHGASLILGAEAIFRIGGYWPGPLMAANLAILALRIPVFFHIRRLPLATLTRDLPYWRRRYQAIGLIWCCISAALCALCMIAGDEPVRLFAIILILGITAGISSYSASVPRFALSQVAVWLAPIGTLAPLIPRNGWVILVLTALYLIGLRSIVRQRHADLLAMIDAEATSRRALVTLSEQETALRAMFDNAAAGVTELDLKTACYTRVNRIFCHVVGRSEAELLANFDVAAMTHPDDRETQVRQLADLTATGRSFQCERRYIRPDGTTVWVQLSVSASALDEAGRPLRVVSIFQDITERKSAEEALRASQDLLILSLDLGEVGTFRRDYKAGLIYCGQETRRMVALPLGDDPIATRYWLATVVPEDVPRYLEEVADAHAQRKPVVSFRYRFRHPDKGLRYAETRSRVTYDDMGVALTSVGVIVDVTDRREAENRLFHLAHHDPLTGLPNRSLFSARLDQALEQAHRGDRFAVLCLDLDHFKDVNDSLGHSIGDSLLQTVTQRLQSVCRPTDTVARLGGDEFAIIQSPVGDTTEAAAFADRLIATLSAPYDLDGHRVVIGTSVGVAVAPGDGLNPDDLLRHADLALYAAKGAGRGRHCFFDPAMNEKIRARRVLDEDLRRALADGEFDLFYQPLVSIATHRVRGFEALIRWRHPTRGLVMPDTFIPLAESNGLIVPIGAFVLHRACAQAALWPSGASVAVNLSASEFASPDLFETVAGALRSTKLDPRRLELEITESTLLQDTRATIETLQKLKALGVSMSMDDFGTGFSALGYLQRFRFDKVKIDRSFIAPLGQTRESLAIVSAVVELCKGLEMETTAEGVETAGQLAILSGLGCTEAQGYYFSRPRPIGEIPDVIAHQDGVARQRRSDAAPLSIVGLIDDQFPAVRRSA